MKRFFYLFFCIPLLAFSLEKMPWMGNPYEFLFKPEYDYDWYKKFSRSIQPLHGTRHDHALKADLNFTFPNGYMDADAEIEFAKTNVQNFSFRSMAIQARYQFLNDINAESFLSLNSGLNVRYTTKKSLKDISSPYHNNFDFEIFSALGKEFAIGKTWLYHLYGMAFYGIDNASNMWIKSQLGNAFILGERHYIYCDFLFEQTFGKHHYVNVDHFFGYGKTHSTYLDLLLAYECKLDIYGSLRINYVYRLIAKTRPERMNLFGFIYTWNFSF
jgi:hypothetical protein